MNRGSHSGDLGDIIASLAVFRQVGGGEFVLHPWVGGQGGPREQMNQKRADFLLPLLQEQPYVTSAQYEPNPQGITHDFATVRATQKDDQMDSLVDWHARHVRVQGVDLSPWLSVEPNEKFRGRIAIARSLRYNNHRFPWSQILRKHVGRTTFIGTVAEHHKMNNLAQGRLPFTPIENALEMARVISACSLFIGNQSFPCWVAMALGVPVIQETWPHSPDSRIVREGSQFIFGPQENPQFYIENRGI